jgi:hypothetical protein
MQEVTEQGNWDFHFEEYSVLCSSLLTRAHAGGCLDKLDGGVVKHSVLEERWVQSSGGGASGGMHASVQTAVA